MTIIYLCNLELHDSLYFATREIGRLYETEAVLHNYALAYILGFVDNPKYNTSVGEEDAYRYFCAEQVPKYKQQLEPLNAQGIYITPASPRFKLWDLPTEALNAQGIYTIPARPKHHTSVLNTWKYADNHYHVEMKPTSKNIPSFGRAKEIAPESEFEFFVISNHELDFPRWVRMGKWASKALLTSYKLTIDSQNKSGEFIFPYPLNPLDVMGAHQVLSFDTINMPPVSLIQNVRIVGEHWTISDFPNLKIPCNLRYCFRS